MHAQLLSCVQLFATPWVAAHQAPPPMEFSRQEYWNGLPFPPSGHLSDPGMEPLCPESPALVGRFFTMGPPGKPIASWLKFLKKFTFSLGSHPNARGWTFKNLLHFALTCFSDPLLPFLTVAQATQMTDLHASNLSAWEQLLLRVILAKPTHSSIQCHLGF